MEKNAVSDTIKKIEASPAIRKLVTAVEINAELKAQLQAAETAEEKAAVAVKHGHSVTPQDMQTLSDAAELFSSEGGELSEAELQVVAGGLSWGGVIDAIKTAYVVYKVAKYVVKKIRE